MQRKGWSEEDLEWAKEYPLVILSFTAFQKLLCYTAAAEAEVAGLGYVDDLGDNKFLVTDVFILPQTADANEATLDPAALNKFVSECECAEKLKFQWHSHGHCGVFFSPQDLGTIAGYENGMMISLIINKAHDMICRIDIFEPMYMPASVNLVTEFPVDRGIADACSEEVVANVVRPIRKIFGKRFRGRFNSTVLVRAVPDRVEVDARVLRPKGGDT